MSVSPTTCPSREHLEGMALGGPTTSAIRQHVENCPACKKTVEQIREDNRFLSGFAEGGLLPRAAKTPAERTHEMDIPGYQLIREIHRGGQGVVYQAVQHSTKRDVAIKVMREGPFATLADRSRFEREIETLGRLDHPNIVAVHDAGAAGGFFYFVMNYVDGQTLDEYVNASQETESSRDILSLFTIVCDAVHAAHLRGVIHRDLKPSNIRVDKAGKPHVLDFGLAKSIDSAGESAMTRTGQFVGSLPWASPEQVEAQSDKVDLRTDIYSLGAILYQLLTGSLPLDVGSNLRESLDKILFREPSRPSAVAAAAGKARIDDELDTIVLKCLSKDPNRRYQSAGDLARDLRRYLAGEPIQAKSDSALYVLRKTLRRYKLRVAIAAAFVILLVVFAAVMSVLYRHSTKLEQEAVQSASSMSSLLSRSNVEQGRMAGMLGNLEQAEQLLWRELLTHREAQDSTLHWSEPPGPPEAYWALSELYRSYPCLRTLTPEPKKIRTFTLARDGQSLWTGDRDGFVQHLDPFGAVLDSYQLALPRKQVLPLVENTGELSFWGDGSQYMNLWLRKDLQNPLFQFPIGASAGHDAFFISRSGKHFAAVIDGVAVIWNREPSTELARFSSEQGVLTAVALSNDDRRLAARDRFGGLQIWDIESKTLVADSHATVQREAIHSEGQLLFSPDDTRIADGWMDSGGRVWTLKENSLSDVELSESPGDYRVHSFSPDGGWLAIGDASGSLRVFDASTGQRQKSFVAHPGRIRNLAFTADGKGIWTGAEAELKLWEFGSVAGVWVISVAGELFHTVDIHPQSRQLFAGGLVGAVQRISWEGKLESAFRFGNEGTVSCIAVSANGQRVAASSYANAIYLWSSSSLDSSSLKILHPSKVSHVCFSPDGNRLASACDDGLVRIWNTQDGSLLKELRHEDRVPQMVFDPTGSRLAVAVRNGALLVWNLETSEIEASTPPTKTPLRAVRYSPDGRWLIVAGADRSVGIWDSSLRERVANLVGHKQEIYCLDVSSNGELIVSGDSGGSIRLWHAGLRRPLATFDGHTGPVMALRFAPDGRSFVSASLDGTLRIWDLDYHRQHIVGNLSTQLERLDPNKENPEKTAAWLRWAGLKNSDPSFR